MYLYNAEARLLLQQFMRVSCKVMQLSIALSFLYRRSDHYKQLCYTDTGHLEYCLSEIYTYEQ